MDHYYVNNNPQAAGEHEVHKENCKFLPSFENRTYLGFFNNCDEAVKKSKLHYFKNSDGCYFCCRECHTR